jgi:hypothetical protein
VKGGGGGGGGGYGRRKKCRQVCMMTVMISKRKNYQRRRSELENIFKCLKSMVSRPFCNTSCLFSRRSELFGLHAVRRGRLRVIQPFLVPSVGHSPQVHAL